MELITLPATAIKLRTPRSITVKVGRGRFSGGLESGAT
jgi:hypothetical protein